MSELQHFAVFAYLWEKEKFAEREDSLSVLTKEVKESKKEFSYWTTSTFIEQTKNPASKILLKTKRKLGL